MFKSKILSIILSVCIIASISVNVYLYNQNISTSKSMASVQAELKNTQSEYDSLSQKIKDGQQNLSAIQKQNSQLNNEVK